MILSSKAISFTIIALDTKNEKYPMDNFILNEAEKVFKSVNFPSQPRILMEIRQEIAEIEPEFKKTTKLAKLIDKDLALAAKIIELVNSAHYGFRHEIKSIRHALVLLGLENFNNIVLASSLREALVSKNMPAKQIYIFFDHSLMVAKISQIISKKMLYLLDDFLFSNVVYMAGLFHDCGIMLLAKRFPDYIEKITKGLKANLFIEKVEEENFNCNHSAVGCLVARSWKLPDLVCQAVRYHHQEDFSYHTDVSLKGTLATVMLAGNRVFEYRGGDIDLYDFRFSSEEFFTNILHELDLTVEDVTEIGDIARMKCPIYYLI